MNSLQYFIIFFCIALAVILLGLIYFVTTLIFSQTTAWMTVISCAFGMITAIIGYIVGAGNLKQLIGSLFCMPLPAVLLGAIIHFVTLLIETPGGALILCGMLFVGLSILGLKLLERS